MGFVKFLPRSFALLVCLAIPTINMKHLRLEVVGGVSSPNVANK